MQKLESAHPVERFASLLRSEWAKLDGRNQSGLDTEDLLDIFWLAHYIQPVTQSASTEQESTSTVTIRQENRVTAPPPTPNREPTVSLLPTLPPETQTQQPGTAGSFPIQLPAATALRSQLDLARSLRPLMQKVPSPARCVLDEAATADRMAEQGVCSPVMVPAPERRFDLAILVEDSPSLKLWEDTIAELETLVERQGAFRQIRIWGLRGNQGEAIELSQNWRPGASPLPPRSAKTLLDPTGRQLIWLMSDCVSERWDYPPIYQWLEKWGKHSPLAIVQLLPERLWERTALGAGTPMRLRATSPGATQAILAAQATPFYPFLDLEENGNQRQIVILPVISLEPEPLKRWASVTMGAGDSSVGGLQIDLADLTPNAAASAQTTTPTPEEQVEAFCATASITAQKLAGLMAAVPVSLPIAHLIQQTLLPQSRQVHVAEVFMSGLLEPISAPSSLSSSPNQYRFPEPVRKLLIDAVPISKTTRVLDTVSAFISERLGLGNKSFAALVASLPELPTSDQQIIQAFAEIGLETLRRLGGEYRERADQLAQYVAPAPIEPTLPNLPPLQEHRYQTAWVEVEPLQRFEFETATIARKTKGRRKEWVITKSPGYGWQRVEDLGNGVLLEMVEVVGGSFQMGSPEDEPERFGDEGPQHEVTLNDFFMGKYPVTQAQWRVVAGLPAIGRELDPDPSRFKGDNRPVEQVSWEDAVEFCARLSGKTGWEYGLPTEAEWEYACRAGTTTPFHFGETISTDLANYCGKDRKIDGKDYPGTYNGGPEGIYREQTTEVGMLPANTLGLFDLHGNVWEWCADDWHESYEGKPESLKQDGNTPWLMEESVDSEDLKRSLRGGSWILIPRYCRSASRNYNLPGVRDSFIGFRVVSRAARTLR